MEPLKSMQNERDLFQKVLHASLHDTEAADQILTAINYNFRLFLIAPWNAWVQETQDNPDNKLRLPHRM